eukprot:909979_1
MPTDQSTSDFPKSPGRAVSTDWVSDRSVSPRRLKSPRKGGRSRQHSAHHSRSRSIGTSRSRSPGSSQRRSRTKWSRMKWSRTRMHHSVSVISISSSRSRPGRSYNSTDSFSARRSHSRSSSRGYSSGDNLYKIGKTYQSRRAYSRSQSRGRYSRNSYDESSASDRSYNVSPRRSSKISRSVSSMSLSRSKSPYNLSHSRSQNSCSRSRGSHGRSRSSQSLPGNSHASQNHRSDSFFSENSNPLYQNLSLRSQSPDIYGGSKREKRRRKWEALSPDAQKFLSKYGRCEPCQVSYQNKATLKQHPNSMRHKVTMKALKLLKSKHRSSQHGKPNIKGRRKTKRSPKKSEEGQRSVSRKRSESLNLKWDVGPKYRNTLCRQFYFSDICRYGDRCLYMHIDIPIAQRNTNSWGLCIDLLHLGSCFYGDACRFEHPGSGKKSHLDRDRRSSSCSEDEDIKSKPRATYLDSREFELDHRRREREYREIQRQKKIRKSKRVRRREYSSSSSRDASGPRKSERWQPGNVDSDLDVVKSGEENCTNHANVKNGPATKHVAVSESLPVIISPNQSEVLLQENSASVQLAQYLDCDKPNHSMCPHSTKPSKTNSPEPPIQQSEATSHDGSSNLPSNIEHPGGMHPVSVSDLIKPADISQSEVSPKLSDRVSHVNESSRLKCSSSLGSLYLSEDSLSHEFNTSPQMIFPSQPDKTSVTGILNKSVKISENELTAGVVNNSRTEKQIVPYEISNPEPFNIMPNMNPENTSDPTEQSRKSLEISATVSEKQVPPLENAPLQLSVKSLQIGVSDELDSESVNNPKGGSLDDSVKVSDAVPQDGSINASEVVPKGDSVIVSEIESRNHSVKVSEVSQSNSIKLSEDTEDNSIKLSEGTSHDAPIKIIINNRPEDGSIHLNSAHIPTNQVRVTPKGSPTANAKQSTELNFVNLVSKPELSDTDAVSHAANASQKLPIVINSCASFDELLRAYDSDSDSMSSSSSREVSKSKSPFRREPSTQRRELSKHRRELSKRRRELSREADKWRRNGPKEPGEVERLGTHFQSMKRPRERGGMYRSRAHEFTEVESTNSRKRDQKPKRKRRRSKKHCGNTTPNLKSKKSKSSKSKKRKKKKHRSTLKVADDSPARKSARANESKHRKRKSSKSKSELSHNHSKRRKFSDNSSNSRQVSESDVFHPNRSDIILAHKPLPEIISIDITQTPENVQKPSVRLNRSVITSQKPLFGSNKSLFPPNNSEATWSLSQIVSPDFHKPRNSNVALPSLSTSIDRLSVTGQSSNLSTPDVSLNIPRISRITTAGNPQIISGSYDFELHLIRERLKVEIRSNITEKESLQHAILVVEAGVRADKILKGFDAARAALELKFSRARIALERARVNSLRLVRGNAERRRLIELVAREVGDYRAHLNNLKGQIKKEPTEETSSPPSSQHAASPDPPTNSSESEYAYHTVHKILEERINSSSFKEYLVRFVTNNGSFQDQWLGELDLVDCDELLEEFRKSKLLHSGGNAS